MFALFILTLASLTLYTTYAYKEKINLQVFTLTMLALYILSLALTLPILSLLELPIHTMQGYTLFIPLITTLNLTSLIVLVKELKSTNNITNSS